MKQYLNKIEINNINHEKKFPFSLPLFSRIIEQALIESGKKANIGLMNKINSVSQNSQLYIDKINFARNIAEIFKKKGLLPW